ncbi:MULTISPECIES: VWA domain-containing protein [Pandoraea]|uniref:VWA domain-containing protein n=1 Tax=Pandoraea TaxID=93217 RepID=UPI001F5C3791|nr:MULTISPECIES: VWA domain-containing protein [Pandoraea]MCI3208585.1 hypothetical protein [Pandoraea sp. LA3]MDN4586614.1 hypothetical protein [Pandoraea capi]
MTGLAHFHFLRPLWLCLLPAAFAIVWAVQRQTDVRRRWRNAIAPHLLDALVIESQRQGRLRPVHLIALVFVLGGIGMAGPSWKRELPPFLDDKAPLAIAIDLSPTMDAVDVTPTRLERAKLKVKALLARREGARTALYAYSGSAHRVLPLTDDSALLGTYVDALQTTIMPVPGRDMQQVLRVVENDLRREPVPGTILFMTDGVDEVAAQAFRASRGTHVGTGAGSQSVVLAIGTPQGGPLHPPGMPDGSYVERDGARVFARLDERALKRFADDSGVPVATFTADGDDDIDWVLRHVQSHLEQMQTGAAARWRDEGWWLTIPLVALAALWFRKGWSVRWIIGLLLALSLPTPAPPVTAQTLVRAVSAASSASSSASSAEGDATQAPRRWRFVDLWLTRDQQGRLAFERGDFAEAAERFDDPMWRGVAQYRAGQYAQAAQSFALVDSPQSDFDQGNALARQGDYKGAQARYRAALRRKPDWPAAQANLTLMGRLIAALPKHDKPSADDDEVAPDVAPDEIRYDARKPQAPQGEKERAMKPGPSQDTQMWMRTLQTTPTALLQREFALEQGRRGGPAP